MTVNISHQGEGVGKWPEGLWAVTVNIISEFEGGDIPTVASRVTHLGACRFHSRGLETRQVST